MMTAAAMIAGLLACAPLKAQFTWASGDILTIVALGDPPTVGLGATLDITTGSSHTLESKTLTNNGTINWISGYISGGNGSVLVNSSGAIFNDLNVSSYYIHNGFASGSFVFNNAGTYVRNAGGTTLVDTTFNNTGAVDIQQGSFDLSGGGTTSAGATINAASGTNVWFTSDYTVTDAASLTGAGTFRHTGGTLTTSGVLDVGAFVQTGGALDGTLTLTDTIFTWNAGTWDAASLGPTTTIGPTATLNIATGSSHTLRRREVINNGVVNWNSGYISGGDGSVFTNAAGATFNDLNVSSYYIQNGFASGSFSFVNDGLYLRDVSGTTLVDIPFTNNGEILMGAGGIDFSDLTLANSSTLSFAISGPNVGSDYGLVSVSTALVLAGDLQFSFGGGFASVATFGQTFTLLNSSSLSGSFLNVSNGARLVSADGLGSFTVHYGAGSAFGANSVVLTGFEAIPEPSTWALLMLGGGVVALGLRRRRS